MDWSYILNFITEIAFLLSVFGICLAFSIFKGRQAIMNLMFGFYLALLIFIEFPNHDVIFGNLATDQSLALAKLSFFAIITALTTLLCYRVMPSEFRENKFESLGKKALLSAGATILIMIFSFHVLPVTEFLTPGTPVQSLFAPEVYFFWWLLAPMVILYVV
ncbi:hypothetical protein H6781_02600 [Candidatus Nomurabacteria bacterium]|nr:hypothetical protein [Candidatus Kaiserbacteria bacterium]MCB9810459.1 hypothetical protein [Candidatus Nomurabacteria bacterium]